MPGYFLDTSALAKLYHSEAGTDRMELLVESPGVRMIISQLSLVIPHIWPLQWGRDRAVPEMSLLKL
jgi:hypothetical protein